MKRKGSLSLLGVFTAATLTALFTTGASAQHHQTHKDIRTKSGIVLVPYAPMERMQILDAAGHVAWKGNVTSGDVTRIPLKPGAYSIVADDDFLLLTDDLRAYSAPDTYKPKGVQLKAAAGSFRSATTTAPALSVTAVPWAGDATYSAPNPDAGGRHVVFLGTATLLKAVVKGGTAPYTVQWTPGDGTAALASFSTSDGYNGVTEGYTYVTGPGFGINTTFDATVTITDAAAATATASYHVIVGDPTNRNDRVNRATDEGLWYLHTQLTRVNGVAATAPDGTPEPVVDEGYQDRISSTAVYAIALENTGHAITGGKATSADPNKDPYVEDLNRSINYLTDVGTLTYTTVASLGGATKTYNVYGSMSYDSHPYGGNGVILHSASGYAIYEGGMQLQALSEAGFTDAKVPNRKEYASFYDLLGDFVDGFEYAQATGGTQEGGWRYSYSYGDSDGSAVAWASIGLSAAEKANLRTPGTPAHATPILVPTIVKNELAIWLNYDQLTDPASAYNQVDYRTNVSYNHHYKGGFGYSAANYGPNVGKTGGGLVALHFIGASDSDPRVLAAQGFLYRFFNTYDSAFNWNSARDSYGMYNMLKGLYGHVDNLTDSDPGAGANDLDGQPNGSIDWFATLADFIAGTGQTVNNASGTPYLDLGHQAAPGNFLNYYVSGTTDFHFEPTGPRNWAVPPFVIGEWGWGSSDSSANIHLITAWDIAILQHSVFGPIPTAKITHPDPTAGETYVPLTSGGAPYQVTFDPAGTAVFHLQTNLSIAKLSWDFGDGTSDTYTVGGNLQQIPETTTLHTDPTTPGFLSQHAYTHYGTFTVTLTVTDSAGLANNATILMHVLQPATLTSLSPATVAAGGPAFTLTVNGSNFVDAATVLWNGLPRTTHFQSPTVLTADIPASDIGINQVGQNQTITVVNGSLAVGPSNALTLTVTEPAPTLTTLSPTQVMADGPDFTLTVNGTNFVPGATVYFAGNALDTTYISDTQLIATVPSNLTDITVARSMQGVYVANPAGSTSGYLYEEITAPVPTATQVSPSPYAAYNTNFTTIVYGTEFVPNSQVTINGSGLNTLYVSPNELTAQVPAAWVAAPGSVIVGVYSAPNGGGSSNTITVPITVPPLRLRSIVIKPGIVPGTVSATGTLTMNQPVPSDTTINLVSYGVTIATVPSSVIMPSGSQTVNFTVSTLAQTTTRTTSIKATLAGSNFAPQAKITVRPISVKSITIAPNPIAGGASTVATITLEAPAAPSSLYVALSSSNPGAANTVYASLPFAVGALTHTVNVTSSVVNTLTNVNIIAALNGLSRQATLKLSPNFIANIALSPSSVTGGTNSTATVTLNKKAVADTLIQVWSSTPTKANPTVATFTIPAGSQTGSFTVRTITLAAGTANQNVKINASLNGQSRGAYLTITP